MNIQVNTKVLCVDGPGGCCTHVIVDPRTENVVQLVVKEWSFPCIERLVPIDLVAESSPGLIHLICTQIDLAEMEPFVEEHFARDDRRGHEGLPFVVVRLSRTDEPSLTAPPPWQCVSEGAKAIQRGARVEAADGYVGQVGGFVVDHDDDRVSHIVLDEGHLWPPRHVIIPTAEIDRIEENTVYLKLDKHAVEDLVSLP